MKKLFFIFSIAFCLLLGVLTAGASDVSVFVNGRGVSSDVAPTIINDRTMLPFRAICEAMQCSVDWQAETSTAVVTGNNITVSAQPDNAIMKISDASISRDATLDVPPVIINSRLLLPVRAFAEAFGAEVLWNGETRTVHIIYEEILSRGFGTSNRSNMGLLTKADDKIIYLNPATGAILTEENDEAKMLGIGAYVTNNKDTLYYTNATNGFLTQQNGDAVTASICLSAVWHNDVCYGLDGTNGFLCRYENLSAVAIVEEPVLFFTFAGDDLFYITADENNVYHIWSAPLQTLTDKKLLLSSTQIDAPCVTEDAIYLREGNSIMKISLPGGDISVVKQEASAFYLNYFNGYLYYTNNNDANCLYRLKADGSLPEEKLTEEGAYYTHIVDGRIYYIVEENNSFAWKYIFEGQTLTDAVPFSLPLEKDTKNYREFENNFAIGARPVASIKVKDFGTITVELNPDMAPQTVANFVSLAESGFYNGLTFHRVMQNFMIQGGCPEGTGTGGPGYNILGEFTGNGVANNLSHTRGAISMARASDPNSGGSQFFICDTNDSFLDGSYAVFGYVTTGMDVVDAIAATPVDYGMSGEKSTPITPVVIESITITK